MKSKLTALTLLTACATLPMIATADEGIVKNNSFEFSNQNWQFKLGAEKITNVDKHGGAFSAAESAGTKSEYRQTITLVPGKKYVASVWVKVSASQGTGYGGMRFSVVPILAGGSWGTYISAPFVTATGDWKKIELKFTATSSSYVLIADERGTTRDLVGYWDDVEVKEDLIDTGIATKGNYAMIYRHAYAANDHIESWMKALAALGIEYDFWFDTKSDLVNGVSTTNRLDSAINPLLDANGKALNTLFIHGGGSGSTTPNDVEFSANAKNNIRAYIQAGGNYFGSCMGLWNAASGWYDSSFSNTLGLGLLGQKGNGSVGDRYKFAVHKYQLSAEALGNYQLNMNHPINRGLAYNLVGGINFAGSGYFDTELAGAWTSPDWYDGVDVIAYNSGFQPTYGDDLNFGNTLNGKPTAIEYKKPLPTFGRVLGSLTHPEHNNQSMPYLLEMLKYSLYGETKTDNSGNHKPIGEFETDQLVYTANTTGTATVKLSAVNVLDQDNNIVDALWSSDQAVLSHNSNNGKALTWNASAASPAYTTNITLSKLPAKPWRILMRLKDNGTPTRITEKTRIVAVNGVDPDNKPVNFNFTSDTYTGYAPLTINFSVNLLATGDAADGVKDTYLDFGDGAYLSYTTLPGSSTWANAVLTKTNVYLAPGKYTASAAMKDNDGSWNIKTINIVVY